MYCQVCGHQLRKKKCGIDGEVPYCPNCKEFRFERFNSAISAIVLNPSKDKILLIQQYRRTDNILIAGYINKGENAKETLIREIKEETGLNVKEYLYNDNSYFKPSETLIHNYVAIVDSENYQLTNEVDQAKWFSINEAVMEIKPESLAKSFLLEAINKFNLK